MKSNHALKNRFKIPKVKKGEIYPALIVRTKKGVSSKSSDNYFFLERKDKKNLEF